MEPVTVNMEGINEFFTQFGPMGYPIAYLAASLFFGLLGWWQCGLAGACSADKDKDKQAAYAYRGVVSCFIGVVSIIITMNMSCRLFDVSLAKASSTDLSSYRGHTADGTFVEWEPTGGFREVKPNQEVIVGGFRFRNVGEETSSLSFVRSGMFTRVTIPSPE